MMATDIEIIKKAIHAALDERDGIDREIHHADHTWVQTKRTREQTNERRRADLYDKIKATIIGGLVLTLVTFVATGFYNVGKFVIDIYEKSQTGP